MLLPSSNVSGDSEVFPKESGIELSTQMMIFLSSKELTEDSFRSKTSSIEVQMWTVGWKFLKENKTFNFCFEYPKKEEESLTS